MEKFKFTLHELITLATIIVSVTTAYVLLSGNVDALKSDVKDVSSEVDLIKKSAEQIKLDQFRMSIVLEYLSSGERTPQPDAIVPKNQKSDRYIGQDDIRKGQVDMIRNK